MEVELMEDSRTYLVVVGFDGWYRETFPRVLAGLVVATGDVDLADDAAAVAYSRAYERWADVAAMESPAGWVFTVGLNHARRMLRRRTMERRALALLGQRRLSSTEPPNIDSDVWEAVRALPQRQRIAVALRYVEDLSQAAIAERMEIAPGTASALLTQARARLRTNLVKGQDDG